LATAYGQTHLSSLELGPDRAVDKGEAFMPEGVVESEATLERPFVGQPTWLTMVSPGDTYAVR
jgi:hypothetical protein